MIMKVVFLDVDGVLNTHSSGFMKTVTKSKLRLLSEIVDRTGAKLVLSSTWRLDIEFKSNLIRKLAYRKLRLYSSTPANHNYPNEYLRGYQIQEWLEDNKVDRYVILDDVDTMLDHQKQFFVMTDPDVGLTKDLANKAVEILNGD